MFFSLSPKIWQACSALSKDELKKDDGLDKLIAKLHELYGVSNEQATFSAYEKFETFQQSEGMNINDYINEFEQLTLSAHQAAIAAFTESDMTLPSCYSSFPHAFILWQSSGEF